MEHIVRTRDGKDKKIGDYARSLAINLMCTECMGWGEGHPNDCTDKMCPLFPFRGISQMAYKSEKSNRSGNKSGNGEALKNYRASLRINKEI